MLLHAAQAEYGMAFADVSVPYLDYIKLVLVVVIQVLDGVPLFNLRFPHQYSWKIDTVAFGMRAGLTGAQSVSK